MRSTPHLAFEQAAEWFRFAFVGILATLIYLITSYALLASGVQTYGTNLGSYLASIAISYFGHAKFTFRSKQRHKVQVPKFVALSLSTFALTNIIILITVDILEQGAFTGSLAVAASIPILTWALSRYWVFRDRDEQTTKTKV